MQVVETVPELRRIVSQLRTTGKTIGFVPTMGALHAGHASLIDHSVADHHATVVSIFVNPLQFGPQEDLTNYPRPRDADLTICTDHGAEVVYYPAVEDVYPAGFRTSVHVAQLGSRWEGAARPTHFDGVTTVVAKLFGMVQANVAYFGQKDFQQQTLIRQMVRDLNMPTQIKVCPIVRDTDGLALSSRNIYLAPAERASGLALSKSLQAAQQLWNQGDRDPARLMSAILTTLNAEPGLELSYATIADVETLEPLTIPQPVVVAMVAGRVGTTRLIDNVVMGPWQP
jgi:pantoate--beta-alanine ligase